MLLPLHDTALVRTRCYDATVVRYCSGTDTVLWCYEMPLVNGYVPTPLEQQAGDSELSDMSRDSDHIPRDHTRDGEQQ
eukprot:3935036-Rhodomonas_salina.4